MADRDQDRLRGDGVMMPYFRLPSTEGHDLGPGNFKHRRNLVMVFLHSADCAACKALLEHLAGRSNEFQAFEAEILVVIGGDKKAAEMLHSKMDVPLPFLFNAKDQAASLCLREQRGRRPAILVADRFGGLWLHLVPDREDGEIDVEKALEQLRFIEIQCPECGVPDEPLSLE